jgi:hypothetical protein
MPVDSTSAVRHPMRAAISSAAPISLGARAMIARSARVCARSFRVPLVWMSTKCSVPVKRSASSA